VGYVSCDHHGNGVKSLIALRQRVDTENFTQLHAVDTGFLCQFPEGRAAQCFTPFERTSGQRPLAGVTATDQHPAAITSLCRQRNANYGPPQQVTQDFLEDSEVPSQLEHDPRIEADAE
jgi:hypothetical protein